MAFAPISTEEHPPNAPSRVGPIPTRGPPAWTARRPITQECRVIARLRLRPAPAARRIARPLRTARVAAAVLAVCGALVAAGPAAAHIATIAAVNASREPSAAVRAPQAPGIRRIAGSYDTAGVLDLDVAFRHPLGALAPSRQFAWTIALQLGTAVSATDPGAGCRASITAQITIGDGLTSVVTPLDGAAIPVTPSIAATGTRFALGSAAIADRGITCLTAVMIGRVHAPATAPGARVDTGCGCTYTTTVTDRLQDASGDPVAWFAGMRPAEGAALVAGPTVHVAWIATVTRPTAARSRPGTGAAVTRLGVASPLDGGPNALLVLGTRRSRSGALWLDLRLPIRPNTAHGWVAADATSLSSTPWRVVVSRAARRVSVVDAGRVVARFGAVIGKPATPTPAGLFSVVAIVPQVDPRGFLGPFALHLSAHSDVLDNYGGGSGRVAIHGRGGASLRDPLGSARSHGCVRVGNAPVTYLATHIPRGAPVIIR